MNNIKKMTDRELLEFLLASQVQMMRKIDRIERSLMRKEDTKMYMSRNIHLDKVYEDIVAKNDHFFCQLDALNE